MQHVNIRYIILFLAVTSYGIAQAADYNKSNNNNGYSCYWPKYYNNSEAQALFQEYTKEVNNYVQKQFNAKWDDLVNPNKKGCVDKLFLEQNKELLDEMEMSHKKEVLINYYFCARYLKCKFIFGRTLLETTMLAYCKLRNQPTVFPNKKKVDKKPFIRKSSKESQAFFWYAAGGLFGVAGIYWMVKAVQNWKARSAKMCKNARKQALYAVVSALIGSGLITYGFMCHHNASIVCSW